MKKIKLERLDKEISVKPYQERVKYSSYLTLSLDEEEGNLTEEKAKHLLRRVTFGPTPSEVNQIKDRPISEVVDELLGDGLDYLPKNIDRLPTANDLNWIDTVEEDPSKVHITIRGTIEGRHRNRYSQFVNWWLDNMSSDKISNSNKTVSERLTFFWHTHWCIEFTYDTQGYIPPPIIYRSNQTLRKYRLGNFKKFVEEMTLDGAYLLYQGLNLSSGKNPNENYARELMELFTMGIGNYSEGDIREAARALTGWRVSAHRQDPKPFEFFDTYFSAKDHDLDSKQVMGETIPARAEEDNTMEKVREGEVKGLLDILFRRRPEPIAQFICTKIYSHFVYSNPSEYDKLFINELATEFIANDFELLPVFRKLFKSKHFYEKINFGVQIKHPVELIVNLEKLLSIKYANSFAALDDLEQELYDPPNVSGWSGYRSWISTKTYPRRVSHLKNIISNKSNNDWLVFLSEFSNPTEFDILFKELVEYTLPNSATTERLIILKNRIEGLSNVNTDNWTQLYNEGSNDIGKFLNTFFQELIKVPDIHLS
ncbi:MAG: DUF1800 domain-containing protein [Ignavibacteria bacterium]|nr:DUF1800 domain-containing protein [Ignavibacteria bacterium]